MLSMLSTTHADGAGSCRMSGSLLAESALRKEVGRRAGQDSFAWYNQAVGLVSLTQCNAEDMKSAEVSAA